MFASCESWSARGLDPSELALLSQVSWVKTVPASAGHYQKLLPSEAEPLDGLRRSLARGLDPSELALLSQVSWVKTVPASAGRYQKLLPSEAEPLEGLRRSLARPRRTSRWRRTAAS